MAHTTQQQNMHFAMCGIMTCRLRTVGLRYWGLPVQGPLPWPHLAPACAGLPGPASVEAHLSAHRRRLRLPPLQLPAHGYSQYNIKPLETSVIFVPPCCFKLHIQLCSRVCRRGDLKRSLRCQRSSMPTSCKRMLEA